MLSLIKFGLGPLLVLQGRRLRRTALRLAEPGGERSGLAFHPSDRTPLRLLVVGDSSAAGVGVDTQSEALAPQVARHLAEATTGPVAWQLVARSGVCTREALAMVRDAAPSPADVALLALGVNDVTSQRAPRAFRSDYRDLLGQLHGDHGVNHFVVTGLPPMHILPAVPQPLRAYLGMCARRLDSELRELCSGDARCAYISLQWAADPLKVARDGFHPGRELYAEWARLASAAAFALRAPSATMHGGRRLAAVQRR